MTSLQRICVYCGSSPGARPAYAAAAEELARALAGRGIGLVYGGAAVGVMGRLADAMLAAGGEAIGVIPRSLIDREIAHPGLTRLLVVESMHERKAAMAALADGFVALPGGFGTLEELFEMLTWAQLGLHRKPCALFNVAGYYDHLCRFLDHMTGERFLRRANRDMLLVADDVESLLARMAAYSPAGVEKWIDHGQT